MHMGLLAGEVAKLVRISQETRIGRIR